MKKALIIAGVVVVVAVVVWFLLSREKAVAPVETGMEGMMAGNTMMEETAPEEAKSVIGSIKEAMGLGQKMSCTYSSGVEGQEFTSTVSIEGNKYKAESNVGGMMSTALFDGETQYVWMTGTKQGFKMTKACMDEMKQSIEAMPVPEGSAPAPKVEDYAKAFEMAKNVSCAPAPAADFTIPADVVFTDQCAMMKQSMEMMKQMQDKMPQGMTMPGAMPQ